MSGERARTPARLITAEAHKLVSTRSNVAMIALPVAYPALIVATARTDAGTRSDLDAIELLRATGDVLPLVWVLIGALAVAGEFRDGSIVSTLLAVPNRVGLLGAKLVALAATALVATTCAIGVALGAVAVAGPVTWHEGVSAWDVVRTGGALLVVAVLFAVIGAGVGEIARHQTAVAVGIPIWMLAAENAVPLALGYPDATRWTSTRSAAAVIDVARPESHAIGASAGLGVLVALAAVLGAVGAIVFEQRDVAG